MRYILLISLALIVNNHYSQPKLSGKVVDSSQSPLPFVAVAALNPTDSAIVQGAVTDERGIYEFNKLKKGKYLVNVKAAGYKTAFLGPFDIDSIGSVESGELQLQNDGKQLDEISVIAIKPAIEFKNGNVTMNIEDSPLSVGNSVYDLLSRMPGVMVDNDNITIQGKSGVAIYIDDRIQPFAGPQLTGMLRAMNASNVQKIEIIRNPSAKYDAAGTAGIINIKMKRAKITGYSGDAGYTFSHGRALSNSANFSLNHKGKKLNVFTRFEGTQGTYLFDHRLYKTIEFEGNTMSLDSWGLETDKHRYGSVSLGADWNINDRNIVGVRFKGVPGDAIRTRKGDNALSDNSLGYENLSYDRAVPNTWHFADYNLNTEHLFDTLGTKLRFSADYYGPYKDLYEYEYNYRFTDRGLNEVMPPARATATNVLDMRIISTRIDFEKKLTKTLNFESGAKAAFQDIFSDYNFYNRTATGEYVIDSLYTNNYVYNEKIIAAYVNFQKEFKKINVQAGLRAEDTDVKTSSLLEEYAFKRKYLKLFPNVSVNYNPSDRHAWALILNRRIWRPNYESLNPNFRFNNLFSVSRGNTFLLPEFSYQAELNHTYKSKLNNSFSFSRSETPIRGQTNQNDSTKVTYFQIGNLQRSNEARYFISYTGDIVKWWNSTIHVGGWYYDFFGMVDGKLLDNYAFSYNVYTHNVFVIPGSYKFELTGWMVGPWLYGGFYEIKPRGSVNAAIKKSFFSDKLNVTAGIYDIFYTAINHNEVNFHNQRLVSLETYDSRRFRLSLQYTFGNIKVQEREVSRAEEKDRAGK